MWNPQKAGYLLRNILGSKVVKTNLKEDFHINYSVTIMSRRKKLSAFDQVSEFDRGRIVSYRDCGLPFREIGSRVGRNQTTVMRIFDRWMQEGTTDRRGRLHPPQCTTSRNMWSMVAQPLNQITPPAAPPDQLWQRVEAAWSAVSYEHFQSLFESMSRRVATVFSNNGGYSGY
ncbi:transposable element Tcb1 transposase [Trichonephila clavipes]|nr:transposable element Tcb1 transposase [Trichonephila clavipes]